MESIISVTPKQEKEIQVRKQIKELLQQLEVDANNKIERALNCGVIGDDSVFMEDNYLLAKAILGIVSPHRFKLLSKEYKKEFDNLEMFI